MAADVLLLRVPNWCGTEELDTAHLPFTLWYPRWQLPIYFNISLVLAGLGFRRMKVIAKLKQQLNSIDNAKRYVCNLTFQAILAVKEMDDANIGVCHVSMIICQYMTMFHDILYLIFQKSNLLTYLVCRPDRASQHFLPESCSVKILLELPKFICYEMQIQSFIYGRKLCIAFQSTVKVNST